MLNSNSWEFCIQLTIQLGILYPVDTSVGNFASSGKFASCWKLNSCYRAILGNIFLVAEQSVGINLDSVKNFKRIFYIYFYIFITENKMAGEIIFPWVKASTGTSMPFKWTIRNSRYEVHSPELESFDLADLIPHVLEVRKK